MMISSKMSPPVISSFASTVVSTTTFRKSAVRKLTAR